MATQQANIWTNADLIRWHIYAALGGYVLKGNFGQIYEQIYGCHQI